MAGTTAQTGSGIKTKILLLYPYYWPHYKAGGPVQSLYNLVAQFREQVDFYLISRHVDIDGSNAPTPVVLDSWVMGPNHEHIFYTRAITLKKMNVLMREVSPDTVVVNGMYHLDTTLWGILTAKKLNKKIIISPRGMLQAWGLKKNRVVKGLYLAMLRMLLKRDEHWHATDEQERRDIVKHFGEQQIVHVASNVPRQTTALQQIPFPGADGEIRLVFLSLINPNKNLHMIIDEVIKSNGRYTLDIYGPIIDKGYWSTCEAMINSSPFIRYKGPLPPWQISEVLPLYHFFVLPTLGENFGHAIFDALSMGVSVIIPRTTPWTDLDIAKAGIYFDLASPTGLAEALGIARTMTEREFNQYKSGSLSYANAYLSTRNFVSEYDFLF